MEAQHRKTHKSPSSLLNSTNVLLINDEKQPTNTHTHTHGTNAMSEVKKKEDDSNTDSKNNNNNDNNNIISSIHRGSDRNRERERERVRRRTERDKVQLCKPGVDDNSVQSEYDRQFLYHNMSAVHTGFLQRFF